MWKVRRYLNLHWFNPHATGNRGRTFACIVFGILHDHDQVKWCHGLNLVATYIAFSLILSTAMGQCWADVLSTWFSLCIYHPCFLFYLTFVRYFSKCKHLNTIHLFYILCSLGFIYAYIMIPCMKCNYISNGDCDVSIPIDKPLTLYHYIGLKFNDSKY